MSELKERPILFSAPMVRAILEGRKTQTRRVAKEAEHGKSRACPYGAPGDRLWVRETWREREPDQEGDSLEFRADRPEYKSRDDDPCAMPWRPSIHMPRKASRINLEVTGVRVERLQVISQTDAIAEGIDPVNANWRAYNDPGHSFTHPKYSYQSLWESINGAESWAANPWVWVVEFKRIQ